MIGNRLKDTRTAMKLSEDEMAARLGMTKESYIRMERNKDWPSIAKLAEIAGTLEISTDYLLSGEYDLVKKPTQTFQCGEPACEWRVSCGDGKFYCPGAGCMKEDAR